MSENSDIPVIEIIRSCGGTIIGRTRLQKLAYLAEKIDKGFGFEFEYYHYGPFSEALVDSVDEAIGNKTLAEDIRKKKDGFGSYSIFTLPSNDNKSADDNRAKFLQKAKGIDALYLELLATALFLREEEEVVDVWKKLKELKPEKAQGKYLQKSYEAYCELQELSEGLQDITALPVLPEPVLS